MLIAPYDFSGKTVRILTDDKGDPWWVGSEVCHILGLYARDSVRYLAIDEKSKVSRKHLGLTPGKDMIIINESGLYTLIIGSKKKKAIKFKRWITHDILPSIRKTGAYSIVVPKTLPEALRAYATEVEAKEKLLTENKRLLPKANALDQITDTGSLKSITEAAKIMSIKPGMFIERLLISQILYRKKNREKTLLPYQYYIDYGWFEVKLVGYGEEKKYTQTKVTPKGIAKLRVRYNLQ